MYTYNTNEYFNIEKCVKSLGSESYFPVGK